MSAYYEALPYFSKDELACKGNGEYKLDVSLAVYLPVLRYEWGKPLIINSGCRSPQHNTLIGGHPRSLHLTDNPVHPTSGCAGVDIDWDTWSTEDQIKFAQFCYARGWSVGLHNGFIHIDRRINIGLNQAVYDYGSAWTGFPKSQVYA